MNKIKELGNREKHLIRLKELGYAKVLYKIYEPSQIELNILRWFNLHPSNTIAKKLKVNRSYVYAVIEKFKEIYTEKEIVEETYKKSKDKKWKNYYKGKGN